MLRYLDEEVPRSPLGAPPPEQVRNAEEDGEARGVANDDPEPRGLSVAVALELGVLAAVQDAARHLENVDGPEDDIMPRS